MSFKEFIEGLIKSPSVRKFYSRIPDDHVLDDAYAPAVFESDEAYFLLTLSEMYLCDKREYWRGFIPLCLVISEFTYGTRREVVPFFVGDKLLSSVEALLKDQQVEYLNTTVAGPLPYVGDNLSLFVGLFRVAVDDFGKAAFNFVQQIAGKLGAAGLSPYLTAAAVVMDGLPGLLGMKQIEYRFGTRDEFSSTRRKANTLQRGYLVYVNCPSDELKPGDLWVEDGHLLLGDRRPARSPCRDSDFCLIKLDHLTERDDYRKLAFYSQWQDVQTAVWQGQHEMARRELLPRLARAVALSPDLIRSDRFHLQEVFKLNFEREVDSYLKTVGGASATEGPATRGTGAALSARAKIQRAAGVGKEISREVQTSLVNIAQHWDKIPHLEPRGERADLTDVQLQEQLRSVKKIARVKKPDPDALAETLVVDAISFRPEGPLARPFVSGRSSSAQAGKRAARGPSTQGFGSGS